MIMEETCGRPYTNKFIAQRKEGAIKLREQEKNIHPLDATQQEIEELKRSMQRLHEEQMKRMTEMVLQLDQCGPHMPDYIVTMTLARERLPALRLMDPEQTAPVSAAARSVNLGSMVDSLDLSVSELYLDGHETLDVMPLPPSLKKLKHMQVLSLMGIPSVGEVIFADCLNITDSSMKDIGKNCAKLCALDISNVRNVTDNGVGHIANGLAAVKSLTFSR